MHVLAQGAERGEVGIGKAARETIEHARLDLARAGTVVLSVVSTLGGPRTHRLSCATEVESYEASPSASNAGSPACQSAERSRNPAT
jgi:hypothetical protein